MLPIYPKIFFYKSAVKSISSETSDSLEKEDAFYLYDQGRLRKQTGYYIYYERNENMQHYIQSQNQKETKIINPIEENDQRVMERVRNQVIKTKDDKKKRMLSQVVGSIFGIGILAVGITIINNYDRMKEIEIKLERLNFVTDSKKEEKVKENTGITLNSKEDKGVLTTNEEMEGILEKTSNAEKKEGVELKNIEGDDENQTNKSVEEKIEIQIDKDTEEKEKQINKSTEEKIEIQTDDNMEKSTKDAIKEDGVGEEIVETIAQNYYYVEKGDTLLSISLKIYHSGEYVKDIKEANQLTDENYIKIGQKLVLPAVQQ